MNPIDFRNDDRFSLAPPWIVERLVDVPFFSVGEDDSQSFHAVIVLKDGQRVGVPVYGRRWIKLNADDLKAIPEVMELITLTPEDSVVSRNETSGHRLQAKKDTPMDDKNKPYRTTETQANKCDLLAINAATCEGEKYVLLTMRMNPYSFEVTEILIPLSQAQDRLQLDLADLLERSPIFKEGQ